ncbi:hypothetical protein PPL_07482 [Heterostelium album PN500]|uniref:F-box domain-containing protein n=1 Tax=Heterostelium pallidum (strain ATCC 26659 / Pp 5 / PN500) TaxID=670386 RepID=D3BG31_HETP5|nr:hypothetical protein PPL_07482 [Heterostelium album PN500]EFA79623.1 hypothetical protein PPL_07482 [Heterostelium album PN500]|eukprot:XP_020431744.1 hypothetical protein PPL_07482 [Heterostelium album PN500]
MSSGEEVDEEFPILVEGIDFKDQNSLINFNRIYNLYYDCLESRNGSLRSQCVRFFVEYHRYKFIHYFDVQGYIKFIVDVFFDPELDVVENMSRFYCGDHIPMLQDIYNRIINDKRKLKSDQLKKRIKIYKGCCAFDHEDFVDYDAKDFYNKVLLKNNKEVATQTNPIGSDNIKKEIVDSSGLDFVCSIANIQSACILPDVILERIVSYSLKADESDEVIKHYNEKSVYGVEYHIDSKSVLNYALVSKQFFKVVSKKITNSYYNLNGFFNLESDYSLIKSPPLFFDYESIKSIGYGWNTDRITQLFSRVETFHIKSDEYDSRICNSDDIKRLYLLEECLDDVDIDFYQDAIQMMEYFVYIPAMPNLKRINVTGYYGYDFNYSEFLKSIITNTPNGNGHGIEQFKIDINKDWDNCPDYSYIDFLEPLIEIHSNTLKSIEINYHDCHRRDMDGLLHILKKLVTTMKQHSYSFILRTNYKTLKEAYQDDRDEDVYQYLLNQIHSNSIILDDYSDSNEEDEEDIEEERKETKR